MLRSMFLSFCLGVCAIAADVTPSYTHSDAASTFTHADATYQGAFSDFDTDFGFNIDLLLTEMSAADSEVNFYDIRSEADSFARASMSVNGVLPSAESESLIRTYRNLTGLEDDEFGSTVENSKAGCVKRVVVAWDTPGASLIGGKMTFQITERHHWEDDPNVPPPAPNCDFEMRAYHGNSWLKVKWDADNEQWEVTGQREWYVHTYQINETYPGWFNQQVANLSYSVAELHGGPVEDYVIETWAGSSDIIAAGVPDELPPVMAFNGMRLQSLGDKPVAGRTPGAGTSVWGETYIRAIMKSEINELRDTN